MPAQPCVLLNGWPGVGKDTVAETLSLLLGSNKASLLDWDKAAQGETFQPVPDGDEEVQKARDACFAGQVEHPSTLNKMVICTDCLSDTTEGRRLAREFEIVANRSKRLLIPINLECHVEENMRRLQEMERRVSQKDKSEWFRYPVIAPAPWTRPLSMDCTCQPYSRVRGRRMPCRSSNGPTQVARLDGTPQTDRSIPLEGVSH